MQDNLSDRDEATTYRLVLRLETYCHSGTITLFISRTYIFT